MSPPIQLFLTTIAMQPVLRQRQEYILRILQTKKIPFTSYDVASDEGAKRLWRRKAPQGKQELPGILVGGTCPGTFQDFEEAVEFAELEQYLRLNEEWDDEIEQLVPPLPQQVVGIPGAQLPAQTQPLSSSTSKSTSSSSKAKPRKTDDLELELDSMDVTDDQIASLLESLGLENEGASERPGGVASVNTPERGQQPRRGLGALGGEAARSAKEKADARKEGGTAPLAVKPLALRKVSGMPPAPAPEPAPEPAMEKTKKPEPTPSSDVDPEAPPVKGEGEVTTEKATEDELAPSGFERKELQSA